jgi:hypothetical protein
MDVQNHASGDVKYLFILCIYFFQLYYFQSWNFKYQNMVQFIVLRMVYDECA